MQMLFPSTEDTNERQDKREVWLMEMPILVRVLQRWCHSQQALTEGSFTVYTDLVHKLKASPLGKVSNHLSSQFILRILSPTNSY